MNGRKEDRPDLLSRAERENMGIVGAFAVPHPPLIIPEVGRGQERAIASTIDSYNKVAEKIAELKPETIIVTSPHSIMYADYFHVSAGRKAVGSFARFRAAKVRITADYDTEFVDALEQITDRDDFPAGTLGERESQLDHATMIPLYFVNKYYSGYHTVRIGLSGLPLAMHYRLGMYLKQVSEALDRRCVIIASGDLSHKLLDEGPYGYAAEGPEYDRKIMSVLSRAAFGEMLEFSEDFCDRAAECGHRSFVIMSGAFDCTKVQARQLSYEGPYGVGYGVVTFEPGEYDAERNFLEKYEEKARAAVTESRRGEDAYVSLARMTVESYVRNGVLPKMPADLPREMTKERAGTFVSIHENGRLRGCIGTTAPTTSCIAKEIMQNAVSASTRDPRFNPIRPSELDMLEISVDVLSPPERIADESALDVIEYGVIVEKGRRRGLLLPNLDGVDSVEQQIYIAKQKAGIPDDDDEVTLYRFRVTRHE